MKLSAIILAAGMSTRMGSENKLLLRHKTSTLINETIHQLSQVNELSELIVVLGHEAYLVKQQLTNKKVNTIVNPDYRTGQTSSIQTGVDAAHEKTDGFMICLGDMPFIGHQDYTTLIDFWKHAGSGSIVRPIVNDKPGHPVIFDSSFRKDIMSETHTEGCRTVIANHMEKLIKYQSSNQHFLLDIDKPEDKDALL